MVDVTETDKGGEDQESKDGKSSGFRGIDSCNVTDPCQKGHRSETEGTNGAIPRGSTHVFNGPQVKEGERSKTWISVEVQSGGQTKNPLNVIHSLQNEIGTKAARKATTGEHVEGSQLKSTNIFGGSWGESYMWRPRGIKNQKEKSPMHATEEGGANLVRGDREPQRSSVITWKPHARAGQVIATNTASSRLGENKKKRSSKGEEGGENGGKREKLQKMMGCWRMNLHLVRDWQGLGISPADRNHSY